MPTPGPLELVIILVIALLILGPGKLPDVGSALGKSIREFRKASSDVQDDREGRDDTAAADPAGSAARPAPAAAAPTVPPRPRRPRPPKLLPSRGLHFVLGRNATQRADDRHELASRPTRPRWPTPTPCATPRRRASP